MATQIKDLEELKKICLDEGDGPVDCYILLGVARSSKAISYMPKEEDKWYVLNEIDGSEQHFKTDEELLDHANSNIGVALERGQLFAY